MFTEENSKRLLEDYVKITDNNIFKTLPKLTHIKYTKNGANTIYSGNLLIVNLEYIVLSGLKQQWSVNFDDKTFYYKKKIDKEGHLKKLKDIDDEIKLYTDDVESTVNTDDEILDKILSQTKIQNVTKSIVEEIKEKFPILKNDKYINIKDLRKGDIVRVVDYDLEWVRTSSIIKNIITEGKLITHIEMLNNSTDETTGARLADHIVWKIKPSKYHIFLVKRPDRIVGGKRITIPVRESI
jgi:hypothetical protein